MTTTYAEGRRLYLSVPCPQPRCHARAGQDCTTPNGWAAFHKARDRASRGEQPKPAKPRRHRLSEAQAERVEWAARLGRYFAPDQYAQFGGNAAERAVADALQRHGLVEQFDTTESGERVFRLTEAGWRAYWHDPKVIRRLPDERHTELCPCAGAEALR